MAYGDGPDDAALQAAWTAFCEQLRSAGERAFKDANARSGAQRVDAFRFLTQNLGQAFDLALETRDTGYPALHTFCGPTRKLGGDCGDFTYQQAWIDGHSTYRADRQPRHRTIFQRHRAGPPHPRPRRAARALR